MKRWTRYETRFLHGKLSDRLAVSYAPKTLQAQRGGPLPAEHLAAEISKAQKDVEVRRQALARIMAVVRAMQSNHNVGVPGAVPLPNNLLNNL